MDLRKIKIILILFFAIITASFGMFVFAKENSSTEKNIFFDSDQDGLSDDEEKSLGTSIHNADSDGDGYSDGSEVKSGYNPLKPAPGDRIVPQEKPKPAQALSAQSVDSGSTDGAPNLTTDIASQLTGLISNANTTDVDISMSDLNNIVGQATANTSASYEDLPELTPDEIKIKPQNYSRLSEQERKLKEKQDNLDYLTAVSYILINNSPLVLTNVADIDTLMSKMVSETQMFSTTFSKGPFFEDLAQKSELTLSQLRQVEVPKDFLDLHTKGVKLSKYALQLNNSAMIDLADPVRGMAEIGKIQGVMGLAMSFSQEVTTKIAQLGITKIPYQLEGNNTTDTPNNASEEESTERKETLPTGNQKVLPTVTTNTVDEVSQ